MGNARKLRRSNGEERVYGIQANCIRMENGPLLLEIKWVREGKVKFSCGFTHENIKEWDKEMTALEEKQKKDA